MQVIANSGIPVKQMSYIMKPWVLKVVLTDIWHLNIAYEWHIILSRFVTYSYAFVLPAHKKYCECTCVVDSKQILLRRSYSCPFWQMPSNGTNLITYAECHIEPSPHILFPITTEHITLNQCCVIYHLESYIVVNNMFSGSQKSFTSRIRVYTTLYSFTNPLIFIWVT